MYFANQHTLVRIEKVSSRYKSYIEKVCKSYKDIAIIKSKDNYICASLVEGYVRLLILPPVNSRYKNKEKVYGFTTIWDVKDGRYINANITSTFYLVRGYKENSIIDQYNKLIEKDKNLFGWNIIKVNIEKFAFC